MATDAERWRFMADNLLTLHTSGERYMVHWYRSQGPGMPPRYYPVSEGGSADEAVDLAIERWERKHSRKYSARS